MTPLDIAILVLKSAANADGGCGKCARDVLDEARRLNPSLPWEMAIVGLDGNSDGAYSWAHDPLNPAA